jgi:hypothetical protein
MNAILSKPELEFKLAKEGFIVVPFLEPEKVSELKVFFIENQPENLPAFYATAHAQDILFRNRMNEKIKSVFDASIQEYFQDYQALGGSYVVKSNRSSQVLNPHQDWNIVDEAKFRSFNIWVPLVDLTKENGAIMVLPESHLWIQNFRGPNIKDDFQEVKDLIWDKMLTLNMKAGEALIYDHRLFHASHANSQDNPRLACVFGIIPKMAQLYYYFGSEEGIEVFESNVDFFMNGNIQEGNKTLRKVETKKYPKFNVSDLPLFRIEKKATSFLNRLFGRRF